MKINVTALHVERGRQMRKVVQHDIAGGLSFEGAVEVLADFLGIKVEAVMLGIAIANDADSGGKILGAVA